MDRFLVAVLAGAVLVCAGCGKEPAGGPLCIGVMLPETGDYGVDWRPTLEWAAANVNDAGGVAGRTIELRWYDTGQVTVAEAARELGRDAQVVGVIGPAWTKDVFEGSPLLAGYEKPHVSPGSTSADSWRAFGPGGWFWRTVPADAGQIEALLYIARGQGAARVALVTVESHYGNTFFDAFGFYATEMGLSAVAPVRLDSDDCGAALREALAGDPDVILAVPENPATVVCLEEQAVALGCRDRLLFSDGAYIPLQDGVLGDQGEGLAGVTPLADPATGFEDAYCERFGTQAPWYAAHAYDALLLLAYGLERSDGRGGAALSAAMEEVVRGTGTPVAWDGDGVREALRELRAGQLPDISGAAGPMAFGTVTPRQVIGGAYGYWRVAGGSPVVREILYAGDGGLGQGSASAELQEDFGNAPEYSVATRTGMGALLVATSSGWTNYRHQADVLAHYRLLRDNGVADDRIVLVIADDLADSPHNPEPGVVRASPDGTDVRADAIVDYRLADLTSEDMLDLIAGRNSDLLPVALDTDPFEDLHMLLVGHGCSRGVFWGESEVIAPDDFAAALDERREQAGYRRAFVAIEACHAGVMGTDLAVPHTLLMTAANSVENSLAACFDPSCSIWRCDQFAAALFELAGAMPEAMLTEVYFDAYETVQGSHVSVYNVAGFGNPGAVALSDFVTP